MLCNDILTLIHKLGYATAIAAIAASLTAITTGLVSYFLSRQNFIKEAESQIFYFSDKLIRHAIEAERYQYTFRFYENLWLIYEHAQADLLKQYLIAGVVPTSIPPGIDLSSDIENYKASLREFQKLSLSSLSEYFLLKSDLQKQIYELRKFEKSKAKDINTCFVKVNSIHARGFDKEFVNCKTVKESQELYEKNLNGFDQYCITQGIGVHLKAIMDIIDPERLSVNDFETVYTK